MHHLHLQIQNTQQCAEMKQENKECLLKYNYMDCIENKSTFITVYGSLSTKLNQIAVVSITENMKSPSQ